jgi:hypothetical protein
LQRVAIPLERDLEDWIEKDPELIEAGLKIIGRQVHVEAGTLDLLAQDLQGRWLIIEVKRDKLHRAVLAQALDYAASVAKTPTVDVESQLYPGVDIPEVPRDVRVCVVGTSEDQSLGRLVDYLSGFDIPISVVSYQVHSLGSGQRVLVRQLRESDAPVPGERAKPSPDEVESRVLALPPEVKAIYGAAVEHGWHPRWWPKTIWFGPPTNRSRSLLGMDKVVDESGGVRVWVGPSAIAEFLPVSEEEVKGLLGEGYHKIARDGLENFVQSIHRLFAIADQRRADEDSSLRSE